MLDQYPGDWSGFIGQEVVKRRLRVAAAAARERGAPMPHQLLTGPAGMGKTALAVLTSREIGSRCYVNSGSITFDEARLILPQMKPGDIWLIDEIHQLARGGPTRAEWMLHLIENGYLLGPQGIEEVPAITVIGTTTHPQNLPAALVARFPHGMELKPYTDDEGALIVGKMAEGIFVSVGLPVPDTHTWEAVARAMCNHPRRIRQLLEQLRDLALSERVYDDSGRYDISEVLSWLGVDELGLDVDARRYLEVMVKQMGGRPVGERALADTLGLPKNRLPEIEAQLIRMGFITRQRNGRYLTPAGIQYVQCRDSAA